MDAAISGESNSQADVYEGQLAGCPGQAADLDAQIAECPEGLHEQVPRKAAAEGAAELSSARREAASRTRLRFLGSSPWAPAHQHARLALWQHRITSSFLAIATAPPPGPPLTIRD